MLSISKDYRPAPFWSWNDKLEPEVLRQQIRDMHNAGLGGFFMHARGGLQTEYLSADWDQCVIACLDEAGKLGMNAWLYDENGWPSGFGGGLVNNLGEKYQQKDLRYEIVELTADLDLTNHIGFYSLEGDFLGREIPQNYTGKVMRIFYEINPFYVDNLDYEVVNEFIRVTHEHYWANIPTELLKNIRGIFTDEPALTRKGIFWSFVMEREYAKSYQSELINDLAYMFLENEKSRSVRVNFWKLVARLFSDSFMKQIFEWCNKHNWELTGHHLLEERLEDQLTTNGAIMAQYQYYHVPGMDLLGAVKPSKVAMTQVVSVAMQCGKKQILTESFAGTSWNCNFSGMRWIYQQQLAFGVNYLCPHLESYSLRGLRKRDYPASFFAHQPWWDSYNNVNDYFSGVGMLLAEGKTSTDVLVLHSMSSAWGLYRGETEEFIPKYSDALDAIADEIADKQISYHFADEQLVDDYGKVENGKFVIRECSYKFIVLPKLTNLSSKMLCLLQDFYKENKNIIVVKNNIEPNLLTVDGKMASTEVVQWFNQLPTVNSEREAANILAEKNSILKIEQPNDSKKLSIISTYRDLDDFQGNKGRFYYIVNSEKANSNIINIEIPTTSKMIAKISEKTFDLEEIDFEIKNDKICVKCYLAEAGAIMLFVGDNLKINASSTNVIKSLEAKTLIELDGQSEIVKSTGNILTLDRAEYRIDSGDWKKDDIITISDILLKLKRSCKLELKFDFEATNDFNFNEALYLICETPEAFKFNLNGMDFDGKDLGYLFDSAFRKILLPTPKIGLNTLILTMAYAQSQEIYDHIERGKKFETEGNTLTYNSEVENIYLYGNFSVKYAGKQEKLIDNIVRLNGDFILDKSLVGTKVDSANLITTGLPFFAGKTTIRKVINLTQSDVEKIKFLRFSPLGANSYKFIINGSMVEEFFAAPYVANINSLLKVGENVIDIEITTSLRNMLGPFHIEDANPIFIGPPSFYKEPTILGHMPPAYNEGYSFVEYGLMNIELC